MLRALRELWPAILPLVLYLLWLWRARLRAQRAGMAMPGFRDGPWFWVIASCLGVGVVCVTLIGISSKSIKGSYVPSHLENGHLIPGRIDSP